MRTLSIAALLAALTTTGLTAQGAGSGAEPAVPAGPWWGHVTALAHDSMRGRAAGTAEHRKAAALPVQTPPIVDAASR